MGVGDRSIIGDGEELMVRNEDRRQAVRHPVNAQGELQLSDGRRIAVRIVNLGTLGALVQITDLEEAVLEGERAVLIHPELLDDCSLGSSVTSSGSIVRVDLDFAEEGVSRHLAIYFDGGPPPA